LDFLPSFLLSFLLHLVSHYLFDHWPPPPTTTTSFSTCLACYLAVSRSVCMTSRPLRQPSIFICGSSWNQPRGSDGLDRSTPTFRFATRHMVREKHLVLAATIHVTHCKLTLPSWAFEKALTILFFSSDSLNFTSAHLSALSIWNSNPGPLN
jgi:hypothetical protein